MYESTIDRRVVQVDQFLYNLTIDDVDFASLVKLNHWMYNNSREKSAFCFDGMVSSFITTSGTFTQVNSSVGSENLDNVPLAVSMQRNEIGGLERTPAQQDENFIVCVTVPMESGDWEFEVQLDRYDCDGGLTTGVVSMPPFVVSGSGKRKCHVYAVVTGGATSFVRAKIQVRSVDSNPVELRGTICLRLANYTYSGGLESLVSGAFNPFCGLVGSAIDSWRSNGSKFEQANPVNQPLREAGDSISSNPDVGSAFFDGSDFMLAQIQTPPVLMSFIAGALVRIDNTANLATGTVFSIEDGSGNEVVRLFFSFGSIAAELLDSGLSLLSFSGAYPTDNAFHDIALFYNGDAAAIFVDGQRVASITGNGLPISHADLNITGVAYLGSRAGLVNPINASIGVPDIVSPMTVDPSTWTNARASVIGFSGYPITDC